MAPLLTLSDSRSTRLRALAEASHDAPDVDAAGWVTLRQTEVVTIGEALEQIVVALAGEAGLRAAWARGDISNEDIGVVERSVDDVGVDELLAVTRGDTPERRAASIAFYSMTETSDWKKVRAFSEMFTGSAMEAQALVMLGRERCANLVSTPRFAELQRVLATALRDETTMINHDIADRLFTAGDIRASRGRP